MKNSLSALLVSILFLSACTEHEPVSRNSSAQTTGSSVTVTASTEEHTPPEIVSEELYDTKPISDAYLNGDPSGLDEIQSAILSKAKEIIDETITEKMSDYDKELAIHDWLVWNVTYDKEDLNAIAAPSEHNRDPYGVLFEGSSICTGYAVTFCMFMDMLGIPCRTIHSTAHRGNEHAWNMVCFDGNWYHVDVTWDDPTPDKTNRLVKHEYFNVTDSVMREEHEWDTGEAPSADSYEYCFIVKSCKELDSFDELPSYIDELIQKKSRDGSFRVKGAVIEEKAGETVFTNGIQKDSSKLTRAISDALSQADKNRSKTITIKVSQADGEKYLLISGISA